MNGRAAFSYREGAFEAGAVRPAEAAPSIGPAVCLRRDQEVRRNQ